MSGPPPRPDQRSQDHGGVDLDPVLSGAERALLEDYRRLGDTGRSLVRVVIDHLRQSPSKD